MVTTYFVVSTNTGRCPTGKSKVIRLGRPPNVETSKLSDTARAVPVGRLSVPNVPECSYTFATAFPVGEPLLIR